MEEIVRKLVNKYWNYNWINSRTIEGDVEWVMKFADELVSEWLMKFYKKLKSKPRRVASHKDVSTRKEVVNNKCEKCKLLSGLYEKTPKSDRDYWIMTELFVLLHGSDECKGD